jgi:hypothetical protein
VTRVDDPVASIDLSQNKDGVVNKEKSGKKRKDSEEEGEEKEVKRKNTCGVRRALDELVASCLTYTGWRDDVREADMYHWKHPTLVDGKLQEMRRKQKMHVGDRSDASLCALDTLVASGLTYAGWQEDVSDVERAHWRWPVLVDTKLQAITKKQKMHVGDRSEESLCALDTLVASGVLTYAGWQDDVGEVERAHWKLWGPSLADEKLQEMKMKQRIHIGDRASLLALDTLVASGILTYAGWQDDVTQAEVYHCKHPISDDKLQEIMKKQKMHVGDRSDTKLCALDTLVASGLTYAGWQDDARDVERVHCKLPVLVDDKLQAMWRKQKIHIGDRSDACLRELDALVASGVLTYAGWQDDVKAAEVRHWKC